MLIRPSCVILLALLARAEKKIELQDIEEDNLKSEKAKDLDKSDGITTSVAPLDFFKNGFLKYLNFETPAPAQPRFLQQYAVSEPPERAPPPKPVVYQTTPTPQQAMVGYLSNVPMQIYLVPQYYEGTSPSNALRYPEPPQQLMPYPGYNAGPGKAYLSQSQFGLVAYQPQVTPAPVVVQSPPPMFAFPMPVPAYPTAVAAPPTLPREYYPQTAETKDIDAVTAHGNGIENAPPHANSPRPKEYRLHTRPPLKDESYDAVQEVHTPHPLILRGPPPFGHTPKPMPYQLRPYPKQALPFPSGVPLNYTPHPFPDPYAHQAMPRRRPNSLLDSYVPSHIQLEYMKRGHAKDPALVYEHLSKYPSVSPRQIERGFLPNQMYHTAAGGVTFGHYKRTPKPEYLRQT